MADTVTTTRQVKMIADFADGDTRTLAISEPKDNIGATEINSLKAACDAVLVGDKTFANFLDFRDIGYYETTVTVLDLTSQGE